MTFKNAIPSLLTLGNLMSGVLALILADLFWSPMLVLLAAFLDLFDGAAARALGAESAIGKELDSLCDMVSFGVVPGYLFFLLAPSDSWVFLVVPLAVACGAALRLAIFNTLPKSSDFLGLASPAAGIFIISLVLGFHYQQPWIEALVSSPVAYMVTGIGIAVAMVIQIPMFSMKGLSNQKDRIWLILLAIGAIVVTLIDWRLGIPGTVLIYMALSILRWFFASRT